MIVEQETGRRRERWDLDTQIYEAWVSDELRETRVFTEAELRWLLTYQHEVVRADRTADVARLLRLAFATNGTYLDEVAADTAVLADHVVQIARLTRQMQGLIRLVAVTTLGEEGELEPLPDLLPPVTGTSGPTGV
jgi:hypothetical protein